MCVKIRCLVPGLGLIEVELFFLFFFYKFMAQASLELVCLLFWWVGWGFFSKYSY